MTDAFTKPRPDAGAFKGFKGYLGDDEGFGGKMPPEAMIQRYHPMFQAPAPSGVQYLFGDDLNARARRSWSELFVVHLGYGYLAGATTGGGFGFVRGLTKSGDLPHWKLKLNRAANMASQKGVGLANLTGGVVLSFYLLSKISELSRNKEDHFNDFTAFVGSALLTHAVVRRSSNPRQAWVSTASTGILALLTWAAKGFEETGVVDYAFFK